MTELWRRAKEFMLLCQGTMSRAKLWGEVYVGSWGTLKVGETEVLKRGCAVRPIRSSATKDEASFTGPTLDLVVVS